MRNQLLSTVRTERAYWSRSAGIAGSMRRSIEANAATIHLLAAYRDIYLDQDLGGRSWITLDMDLWSEEKTSPEAEALAKMLWVEIDWPVTTGTCPFAQRGLGEYTNKTTNCFRMVLDACGDQKPDSNSSA